MTESVCLSIDARRALVRRGLLLNGVTLGYNTLEAAVSLLAGFAAGSVALIGFGADSLIEVSSALAAQWRLRLDTNTDRRDHAERTTLRIVGWCFVRTLLPDSGRPGP